MAENVNKKLFSEFAPNTMQEWLDKVTADLKGADFNKKLVWKTNEGFDVQPMYRLENMDELKNLKCFPGEFPFVRGNKKDNNDWFVRQDIVVENFADANKKALEVLNKGVDSLGFVMQDCKDVKKSDLETLLNGICLECVEVNFVACCNKGAILSLFKEVVADKGISMDKVKGGINIDPLSKYILTGKFCSNEPFDVVKSSIENTMEMKNFKCVEVGGFIFNNSGASIVQELGFSLAAGVEYLDKLTDAGLSINDIAPSIRFHFATGSKYFLEIAKLRAGRYLWAQIVKSYNPCCDEVCKMYTHSETSEWNKTVYDPNVNMLRTQTEAMSAVIGGVDSFTVHPYDYVYECHPSELGERMARNQQLLLKEESHFGKIADAAGGSYYIEELTEYIAEAAWKLFLDVQDQGGYLQAVKAGYVQEAINMTAKKREQDIANRRENFLGTNQFPNFTEKVERTLCNCIFEPEDYTEEGAEIVTLKPFRGTQAFELMRYKTDAYAQEKGHRPIVYMFPMGNLAMRKARAQFACNFFACAGFNVMDNNGFSTVEEGVQACLDNNADIVVICSSDEEYATIAPEVCDALKDKAVVVIAGNPECKTELEAKGLTNYVHVKCNVLEDLKAYQQKLGIN